MSEEIEEDDKRGAFRSISLQTQELQVFNISFARCFIGIICTYLI